MKSELLKRIELTYFALLHDKLTDVVLLVYLRYIFRNSIPEDVIFTKPLKSYRMGVAILDSH